MATELQEDVQVLGPLLQPHWPELTVKFVGLCANIRTVVA